MDPMIGCVTDYLHIKIKEVVLDERSRFQPWKFVPTLKLVPEISRYNCSESLKRSNLVVFGPKAAVCQLEFF
ncbi:hypothetical protein AKJ16_DCAP00953 [Drosera capensis]